ncbi:zinc-binding dehydrogenase [Streptomyces sp. NPDC093085]|uniref:zinc-binding dehydrogenase n=1 Tax=Streptomyces sp. NPDC093085 TaxID=3155068 RepID=UPI00342B5150
MAFLTAYGAFVELLRPRPGDHVVITAATSSVGLAAIQTALRLGAGPIATTNSAAKERILLDAGAAHVVVTDRDDLVDSIRKATGGRGADGVFDAVAGPAVEDLARATRPDGVILVHGGLSGRPTPMPGLSQMLPVFVRPYTLFEFTDDPVRLDRARHFITTGLVSGAFTPVIDRTFDLTEVVEAHRYLESGAQFGKIVLTVTPCP